MTNKALIGIVICSILMLLVQLTMQSMTTYVYPNYFGNVQAQSAAGMVGLVMTLGLSTVVVKLQVKMGRKELAIAGSLFGAVIFFITWLTHTKNAWLYVDWLHCMRWAMITDVIDDTYMRTFRRNDLMHSP